MTSEVRRARPLPFRQVLPTAPPGEDPVLRALPALKALAEPSRLRIVVSLREEQLCVCHLVEQLGLSQPLVSNHLRVLREAGLVQTERYRYWTYYRLCPDALAGLGGFLGELLDGATGDPRRRPCED